MPQNPILYADYPDPDVIRVENAYYMVSTSMHYFPGAQILRSFDLLQWEHLGYVFDRLGDSPAQALDGGNIYGKGMWAATLRYDRGTYHIVFVCNDTHRSYHFTATQPQGPWTRHAMEGFYYDPSLLFDDDGRVYIAHGNREIRITELLPDLSAPMPGGLNRVALQDSADIMLGYEGSHFYQIYGQYYLFNIHWARGKSRTECCHRADTLTGAFTGGEIVNDDAGLPGYGAAQGGVVQTPEGAWYLMLFQDHGAEGRMPVLAPMIWENGFPRVPQIPKTFACESRPLTPLYTGDSLRCAPPSPLWQWNHEPHEDYVAVTDAGLCLTADRVVTGLEQSVNTLTQRTFGKLCTAEVTVNAQAMNPGDYAGLCAFMGCYAQLAITREESGFALSLISRIAMDQPYAIAPSEEIPAERVHLPWESSSVRLRARFDFRELRDQVCFDYWQDDRWVAIGEPHRLVYRLDHFVGCRIGLFCYATRKAGGSAVLADFTYRVDEP